MGAVTSEPEAKLWEHYSIGAGDWLCEIIRVDPLQLSSQLVPNCESPWILVIEYMTVEEQYVSSVARPEVTRNGWQREPPPCLRDLNLPQSWPHIQDSRSARVSSSGVRRTQPRLVIRGWAGRSSRISSVDLHPVRVTGHTTVCLLYTS